jgi:hypothetical protein
MQLDALAFCPISLMFFVLKNRVIVDLRVVRLCRKRSSALSRVSNDDERFSY